MIQKDVHVVFSKSAQGTFVASQEFDLSSIQLVRLEDNLNIGPICDIDPDEGIEKRKDWVKKFLGNNPGDYAIRLNVIESDIEKIKQLTKHHEDMGNLFLWTGCFANEILSTARLLYHLPQAYTNNIYMVDFANVAVKRSIDDMIVYPKTLIATEPARLNEVSKHFKLMDKYQLSNWKEIWKNLRNGNTILRVLQEDGKIYEEDEAYFDPFLITNCKDEFQSAARVIGYTLCDIDFAVGDDYLNWRLKQLSLMKKIETCGKLKEVRDYEVRTIQI